MWKQQAPYQFGKGKTILEQQQDVEWKEINNNLNVGLEKNEIGLSWTFKKQKYEKRSGHDGEERGKK